MSVIQGKHHKRIKIFEKWKVPNFQCEEIQKHKLINKKLEVIRTEELIREASLIILNINTFKQRRNTYREEFKQLKRKLVQYNKLLFDLTNNPQSDERLLAEIPANFQQLLFFYYFEIRKANNYFFELQNYFQATNMANYDKKNTKLQYTKTYALANQELEERVNTIERYINKLRQALAILEKEIVLSHYFGKEENFDDCFQHLHQSIDRQNIIEIHLLMMYQLQDLDDMVSEIKRFINTCEKQYSKYQAIYDSFQLMKNEQQEIISMMKSSKKMISIDKEHGYLQNEKEFNQKINEKQATLATNLKIYQSNLTNFVRVSAETNMRLYFIQRTSFTKQLNLFQQFVHSWKSKKQKIVYLYERNLIFHEYLNNFELTQNISEKNKTNLVQLYNQCLEYEVNDSDIKQYQNNLLAEIQLFLSKNNIPASEKQIKNVNKSGLEKEIDFFVRLNRQPADKKVQFLRQNKKIIEAFLYELEVLQEKRKDNGEIIRYQTALSYCNVMSSTNKTFDDKNENIFEIYYANKQYQNFPLGFSSLFFNYMNDLNIIIQAQYLMKGVKEKLSEIKQIMNQAAENEAKFDKAIQTQINKFEKEISSLFVHEMCLRKTSKFNIKELGKQFQDKYWLEVIKILKECSTQIPPEKIQSTIEKQDFYTLRVLCFLCVKANQDVRNLQALKIVNIESTCLYILSQLDKYYLGLSPSEKIVEIAKLSLFQEYLTLVISKFIDVRNYLHIFTVIKEICVSLLYAEKYVEILKKPSNSKKYFQPLLHIHFNIEKYSFNFKKSKWSEDVGEKARQVLRNLQKTPLTIATKHNINEFIFLWQIEEDIERMKVLRQQKLQIEQISAIYVIAEHFNESKKILEINYEPYENIIVKQNKQSCDYFQRIKEAHFQSISSVDPEIQKLRYAFLNEYEKLDLNSLLDKIVKKLS